MAYNLMNNINRTGATPGIVATGPGSVGTINQSMPNIAPQGNGLPVNSGSVAGTPMASIGQGLANFSGNLGMGSGAGGTDFASPTINNPNIIAPLQAGQLAAANQAGISSVNGQQALLAALQQQMGLGNQTAALNAQTKFGGQLNDLNAVGNLSNAALTQNQLSQALANAGGINAQRQALGQQNTLNDALSGGVNAQNQALAGLQSVANQQNFTGAQLQGIANGTGPNPAMAALNQATGQNVANQAALMAGQRGAGANVGLLARQAAQQGAATQQQAAGQAATMQANQSLAALQQLQAQQQAQAATQAQIGGLGSTQAQMQQAGIGQLGSMGAGLTAAQQNAAAQQYQQALGQANLQQGALAQQGNLATTMAGQQIAGTTAATQAAQNEQQQQLQAQQAFNATQAGLQQNVNTANAGLAQTQMATQKGILGGALNAAGTAAGLGSLGSGLGAGAAVAAASAAYGGEIKNYAEGDIVQPQINVPSAIPSQPLFGPNSSFSEFLSGFGQNKNNELNDQSNQKTDNLKLSKNMAQGGQAHNLKQGGAVKAKNEGEKAKFKGNSYSNDTIPAMLSEGEVVIPRSVMQSKDPIRGAADFVRKVMAKKGKKYA